MTVGDFKANFSEVLKKVLNGEKVARLVLGSGAKNKKEKLESLKSKVKLYS